MNLNFSRVCKLMTGRKVFAKDVMKRDSTGPQHILEEVQKLRLALNPVAILKFSRGLDLLAWYCHRPLCLPYPYSQRSSCKSEGPNHSCQQPGHDGGDL